MPILCNVCVKNICWMIECGNRQVRKLSCPLISKLHAMETCGRVNLQIQICLIWTPNRTEWSASSLTALRSRQEVLVKLSRKLHILYSSCTPEDSKSSTGNGTQSSRVFTSSIYLSAYSLRNLKLQLYQATISISYKPPSSLFLIISAENLTFKNRASYI
jgi:hypothetical protein